LNLFERLGLKDAKIVDQNLDVAIPAHHFLGRCSRAKVTDKPNDSAAGRSRDVGNRLVHASFGAASNNNMCAFPGQMSD
jgi:hypothetical protein